jgi:hypothetical protein
VLRAPCVLLLLGLLASGCVAPAAPTASSGQALGDCSFLRYPDGSAVSCDAATPQADTVRPEAPGMTEGWGCFIRERSPTGDAGYTLYRTTTGDRLGIAYEAHELEAPLHGVWLAIQENYSYRALWAFEDDDARGFVSPAAGEGGPFELRLYHFIPIVNQTRFQGEPTLEVSWSLFRGNPWAVYHLSVDGRTFHLEGMAEERYTPMDSQEEFTYWLPESAAIFDDEGLVVAVDKRSTLPFHRMQAPPLAAMPACSLQASSPLHTP